MIKISFRKGGDKAFYAVLRRSLLDKTWEVSDSPDKYFSCGRRFRMLLDSHAGDKSQVQEAHSRCLRDRDFVARRYRHRRRALAVRRRIH